MSQNSANLDLMDWNKSSQKTYEALKTLLDQLECEDSRVAARLKLQNIIDKIDQFEFLNFSEINIGAGDGFENLCLLQLPSTFAPEEWSYTFYEGINRYPPNRFFNKKVCELGCGNGWITLSIAIKTNAAMVYGVDINPKAVVLSKLNLYLNALNEKGESKFTQWGEKLLDKVVFSESDLLSYFSENSITLDIITGCIPQVLSPDSDLEFHEVKEEFSDEELYDLSNYAPSLGYIEDQFGLSLIAKALEQSIDLLNSNGRVILNLGGRPGQAILESLFLRRGFKCKKLWETKVWQAGDTDIAALVAIEKQNFHKFEFFTSLNTDVSISATTAQEFVRKGGRIAHSLSVFEGEILFPAQTKALNAFVNSSEFNEVKGDLDLSFGDTGILEEKIEFLSNLSSYLSDEKCFGYENVRGIESFRVKLAKFFAFYYKIKFNDEELIVLPSRRDFIRSLIMTYDLDSLLITKSYFKNIYEPSPIKILRDKNYINKVFECPSDLEVGVKLLETIKPAIFICELAGVDGLSYSAIEKLISISKKVGTYLILDVSNFIVLDSKPKSDAVFRYFVDNGIPDNVSVLGSFLRNAVYQKLSVAFLISSSVELISDLSSAAELSYSRVPVIAQIYYESLLNELLNFQLNVVSDSSSEKVRKDKKVLDLKKSFSAKKAFSHNAVQVEHRTFKESDIRLDYGENELGVSLELRKSVFSTFAKKNFEFSNEDLNSALRKTLRKRYGISERGQLLYGLGVASLFSSISYEAEKQGVPLVIPKANYGMFSASGYFNKCRVVEIETSADENFQLTATDLNNCLKSNKGAFVYIQFPVLNPTGQRLSEQDLNSLLKVISLHGGVAVIDTTFSGLMFSGRDDVDAVPLLSRSYKFKDNSSVKAVVMGGPSKEYAAGGLRVGFLWTNSNPLFSSLSEVIHAPHKTSLSVFAELVKMHENENSDLIAKLEEQRNTLRRNADALTELLESYGWDVLKPNGGLFLIAKAPEALHGNDAAAILYTRGGVAVNSDTWTGIPNYYRFVLSIDKTRFNDALSRLKTALAGN